MNKSESIVEISKAMVEFHKEVKQPLKDKDNPFFRSKYVPLENVVEAITDVAPKHGLSFMQWALNDESGRVGVATIITHESGEYIEFDPVFMQAEKNTPQGAGSLITYLKRYTLSAVFGITSDQDDDGNDASGGKQPQQNNKMATEKQLGLLHYKSKELADIYQMGHDELKTKLGIKTGMSEIDFKQVLKRVTDGIEKAPKDTEIDLPADLEHEDAGDRI